MDLARACDALERRSNIAYQWNFMRNLKARMRRKAAAFPGRFALEPLRRSGPCAQFDEAYTAPHHGFRDATDYYHRASALRVIDRIRVPALIITAEDDPFVPHEPFARSGGDRQSRTSRVVDHAARRPLRRSSARRDGLRRLLGGARDRASSSAC